MILTPTTTLVSVATPLAIERAPSVLRCSSRGHARSEESSATEDRTNDVAMQKLLERVAQLEAEVMTLQLTSVAAEGRYKELDASTAATIGAQSLTISSLVEENTGLKGEVKLAREVKAEIGREVTATERKLLDVRSNAFKLAKSRPSIEADFKRIREKYFESTT